MTQDGGSGLISFHGISGLYNQNYVDGANNNQMLFCEARGRASGAPYVYSVDSIKEFQAETSNYSVEFGQAAGGQVNAITKSGTNDLHGDLFYFLRYPTLNALDPLTKYNALYNQPNPTIAAFLLTQPTHQQQQFGGSVGGPIIKDKLFYFFTYDGFRKVGKALYTDSNYISTTPSARHRHLQAPRPAIPSRRPQCPDHNHRDPVHGRHPLPDQSSQRRRLALPEGRSLLPARGLPPEQQERCISWTSTSPTISPPTATAGGRRSPTARRRPTGPPTTMSASWWADGQTDRQRQRQRIHGQWGRDLETAGANASGPSVAMGALTFGMPNALPRVAEPDEHRIQFSDVFSSTKGRHTFKFGGDVNIVHEVMINLFQGGGIYSYGDATNAAQFPGLDSGRLCRPVRRYRSLCRLSLQHFVQTVDQVNTAPGTQGKDDFWMNMFDGFAEDTWKVQPNLTVTAGVRYDVQLTPAPAW